MNWELFVAAVAIGAMAELLMLSPEMDSYRRTIAGGRILIVAAILAAVIPPAGNAVALAAFAIPAAGRVVGEWVRIVYLRFRIGREVNAWEHQHRTNEKAGSTSVMPSSASTEHNAPSSP
jgi:hypothetical protein